MLSLLLKDLEIENEDLKERLRKIQQEQRILVDKVNGLQLQLNEVNHLYYKKIQGLPAQGILIAEKVFRIPGAGC